MDIQKQQLAVTQLAKRLITMIGSRKATKLHEHSALEDYPKAVHTFSFVAKCIQSLYIYIMV